MKRIDEIRKVYESGLKQYRVQLCPNYSFDYSGSEVTYVLNIRDICEATKHIVFCNGID